MSRSFRLQPLFELAKGGMGAVSVAMRVEGTFRRLYVVKRLLPELERQADTRAMFLEEARIAGHLRHPNVVGVLDVGSDRRGPYLVMEYVDGITARELLKRSGGKLLPLQVGVEIGLHVARGLDAAHDATDEAGRALEVIHRDVSPHNVLIGFDGVARLSDFGIARAAGRTTKTSTGVLKGKLGYMAPEQLRFESPSRATDLFALGVVLFELFTSRRLYPLGKEGLEGPKRILSEAPPDLGDARPEASPELVQLMFELLAKHPEDRPPHAREVAERLDAILADLRAVAPAIAVADLLADVASDAREERHAKIETALASTPKLSKHRLWIGGAVAASLLLGALAWAAPWRTQTVAEPETAPFVESVDPEVIAAPDPVAETVAPVPMENAPPEVEPQPVTPRAQPMRAGRSMRARTPRTKTRPSSPAAPSAMSGLPTWDWDDE
ncbi:MAG: protein kinase [Myxococcota bacterium]